MKVIRTSLGETIAATGKPGYVYVLAARHGGVKIGGSTDPERRLATINRGKTIGAELVCAVLVNDYERDEQRVHAALSAYRLSNEWYSCPVEMAVALVRKLENSAAPR